MPLSVAMGSRYQYTLLISNADSQLIVYYKGVKYTLVPKGYCIIRSDTWDDDDTDKPTPPLKFSTGDMELSPVFSRHDLFDNKRIVIFGDLVNASSCRMTPRTDPETYGLNDSDRPGDNSWFHSLSSHLSVFPLPTTVMLAVMEDEEKKVRIWHNQCQHLLKKYQEAVKRVQRVGLEFGDFSDRELELFFHEFWDHPTRVIHRYFPVTLDRILSPALHSSFLEGMALLSSCGYSSYNEAAFALTSVSPRVPTFSKFALAIRELAWSVDCLCLILEGKPLSLDSWKWCEESCRLVNSACTNRLDASEDDSLEADVRRQNVDREALRSSLDLKLRKSSGLPSFKFLNPATWPRGLTGAPVQSKLESTWRKRLQASACAPGSFSPLDAFVIDDPDTSFVQVARSRSRSGTSKSVQKCKWLGQTVAVSTMSNVSKVSAQAETGFLARVQHPNVVEWMGYAYKEELRDPNCYRECYLVTEHMECDLDDLITERLEGEDGKFIENRSPFEFFVAVDIAMQIVEAMIHVHRCRALHRDLKPKNILASQKFRLTNSEGPFHYTIKLIDFGSSRSGDEGSYFNTRKQGTPIYMAPEVWESEDSRKKMYSWSADVYSFGLTCFEIFSGRLPLEDGKPRTHDNIQKALCGEILFPSWCPTELKALIVKCWAQEPSDRPSFEDIRKALWRLKVYHRLVTVSRNSKTSGSS